jgi:putative transposase
VFVAVDHRSAACVGIHTALHAMRFEVLEPIRQGVRRHFGAFAKDAAHSLSIRHDHGSQYMSDAFQKELAFLGIESSPAFVRASEGNGCAERFIRISKENLLWERGPAGPGLRHRRVASPRAGRVPGGLQHDLAH